MSEELFQYDKYKTPTIGADNDIEVTSYNAGSDNFANRAQMVLSFQHVPSQTSVYFKAFITTFTENYTSNWASETVYGRTDPIYLFQNTQRIITLGFKIPAVDTGEAYENLARVQRLTQFLYPNYTNLDPETGGGAQTISQSPLVRLKVLNLLRTNVGTSTTDTTAGADEGASSANSIYDTYISTGNSVEASNGLLGIIQNIVIDPHLTGDEGVFVVGMNTVLPKLIDVNVSFAVIHEQPLGWQPSYSEEGNAIPGSLAFKSNLFPYGAVLENPDTPASTDTSSPDPAVDDSAASTAASSENAADEADALGGNANAEAIEAAAAAVAAANAND